MQRCWIFDTALFPKMLKNNINLLFVFMTSVCLFMSGLLLLQSLGSCMLLMKWKCYIMNVEVDNLQSLNTVQTWDVLTYPHNKAHMCDSSLSKGKRHSILLCALKLLSDSVLQRCPYVCFLLKKIMKINVIFFERVYDSIYKLITMKTVWKIFING